MCGERFTNLFIGRRISSERTSQGLIVMHPNFAKFWESVHHMTDTFIARLPPLVLSIVVLIFFYILSIFISRLIRRATRKRRQNLGVVFARLVGAGIVLLGVLVAVSIVAPSFQASDLIKVLGIGGVAIGFAFQNILQNFLAGLLLLWAEPFRIGDEIKLDAYEGTVEEIQTRATIIKTYDERRVVIPNADLFTHSVIVNTAADIRRWEYDFTIKGNFDLTEVKSRIVSAVRNAPGTLSEPSPEALVLELGDLESNTLKLRILWWTKASRQHQMLTSYDTVLTAVRQTFAHYMAEKNPKRDRAA
jgi:small conductance mechanosensitive channel